MRTIQTNLNDRTKDHCIKLSPRQLSGLCVRAGDRVRLTDADMEVEARLELRAGEVVAVPHWSTLSYVD